MIFISFIYQLTYNNFALILFHFLNKTIINIKKQKKAIIPNIFF